MVFGRDKEKVTPAQAAADVRERYDEKINQYLRKVGAAGPAWLPDFDLLGRLFSWGEKVLDERNNLRSQLSSAEKRFDVERKRLHSQLSQVEEKFDVERIQFQGRLSQAEQTIQVDRKRFQGQFTSAEENNANEQNKLQRQLADAKGRIRELAADLASAQRIIASNESEKETIESQYQEELESLKNKYSTVTKKEKDIHGREVKKLVGQLLVNQDDNVGWTDDKLKFRFQQLQSSIISLVSPRHKEYRISTDSMVTLDLDPTGFLTRTNKSNTHYLLQSIIWRILYDRFFSTPFGLGVLGDGKGQEKLLDLVFAWIEFLGGTSRHKPTKDQVLEFFCQRRMANNWRSAVFQCTNEALADIPGKTSGSSAPVAIIMTENVNQAISSMTEVLKQVSKLSDTPIHDEMEEVQHIAQQARDLAVQFGLQQAQLLLYMPKHGDVIQIGEEVYDCEDGDCDRGAKHSVALVTLPGLQKIGDGRADIQSKRTLIPCEIYPN